MAKDFLLYTKQCRQCGKPLSTTSSVKVVHDECRAAYYKLKAREYANTKGTNRPSFRERDRRVWFIDDRACEACGYTKITRERKFFHRVKVIAPVVGTAPVGISSVGNPVGTASGSGAAALDEFKVEVEKHTLCPNCILLYRFGFMEALTWKLLKPAP